MSMEKEQSNTTTVADDTSVPRRSVLMGAGLAVGGTLLGASAQAQQGGAPEIGRAHV